MFFPLPQQVAPLKCLIATQYAQILCRLEKKLAKQIGPEEFLQCSNMVLLDKQVNASVPREQAPCLLNSIVQKKWDQPSPSTASQGAQDPKKTCNLETYLDWSARLRLFVCNEILQVSSTSVWLDHAKPQANRTESIFALDGIHMQICHAYCKCSRKLCKLVLSTCKSFDF